MSEEELERLGESYAWGESIRRMLLALGWELATVGAFAGDGALFVARRNGFEVKRQGESFAHVAAELLAEALQFQPSRLNVQLEIPRRGRVSNVEPEGASSDFEVEVSRAMAVMPELVQALADGDPVLTTSLLREYTRRNGLPRSFTGDALLALVRADRGWADRVRRWRRRSGRTARPTDPVENEEYAAALLEEHSYAAQQQQPDLTPPEVQALQQAAEGRTSDETGEVLFLSGETIKSHRKMAIRKLGARNVTEAVAVAIRRGIIT